MEAMKRAGTLLLVLTAACSSVPASRSGRVQEGLRAELKAPPLPDSHEYGGIASLEPGQWARYRIARNGSEQEITLGVVARGADHAWIEVTEEGEPRRASLRRVGRDGRIEQAFYREIPARGEPSPAVPQPITQAPAPETLSLDPPQGGEEKTETVAGRALQVLVVTHVERDEVLGREYREEFALSADVPPLYFAHDGRGLVRHAAPRKRVQLVDFGVGYAAHIAPPAHR